MNSARNAPSGLAKRLAALSPVTSWGKIEMPSYMSFSMTTEQARAKSKTVTRRLGWHKLKPGTRLWQCVKAMGLKPGEKVERIWLIEVVDVRPEPLQRMIDDRPYGLQETTKEGFPVGHALHEPVDFVDFLCDKYLVKPQTEFRRIEFSYVEEGGCR